MEEYLGRVRGLRITAEEYLPPDALTEVDTLIEHGEPAEGVCSLAWALHNAEVAPPDWMLQAIQDLTRGIVDRVHMPPSPPETTS